MTSRCRSYSRSREKSTHDMEYLTVLGPQKDVHVVRSNNFRLRYYQRLNIVRPHTIRTENKSLVLSQSRKVSISPERNYSSAYADWEARKPTDLDELEPIIRTKSLLEGAIFEMEM